MKLLFYFFCSFLIFTSGIKSLSKAYSSENKSLNIGLIIPLSGEYEEIGKSVLKSIRMGLNKINNKNIKIFPRDNKADPEETVASAKELEEIQEYATNLEHQYQAVLSSSSWKLTQPFREIIRRIRGQSTRPGFVPRFAKF